MINKHATLHPSTIRPTRSENAKKREKKKRRYYVHISTNYKQTKLSDVYK